MGFNEARDEGGVLLLTVRLLGDRLQRVDHRFGEPFVPEPVEAVAVFYDIMKNGNDARFVGGLGQHDLERVRDIQRARLVSLGPMRLYGDFDRALKCAHR